MISPFLTLLTSLNKRLLVDAGTGVRTHKLTKRIDEGPFIGIRFEWPRARKESALPKREAFHLWW